MRWRMHSERTSSSSAVSSSRKSSTRAASSSRCEAVTRVSAMRWYSSHLRAWLVRTPDTSSACSCERSARVKKTPPPSIERA